MTKKLTPLYVVSMLFFLFGAVFNSVPYSLWGLGVMAASIFEDWYESKQEKDQK